MDNLYDKFLKLKQELGEDTLLTEIYDYFATFEMRDCIESIASDWEVCLDDE